MFEVLVTGNCGARHARNIQNRSLTRDRRLVRNPQVNVHPNSLFVDVWCCIPMSALRQHNQLPKSRSLLTSLKSVTETRVSMLHRRFCGPHSCSLQTLVISIFLSLCLCLEASDVRASNQLPCVHAFHSVDTHNQNTNVSLWLAHCNPCLCGFLCLS